MGKPLESEMPLSQDITRVAESESKHQAGDTTKILGIWYIWEIDEKGKGKWRRLKRKEVKALGLKDKE